VSWPTVDPLPTRAAVPDRPACCRLISCCSSHPLPGRAAAQNACKGPSSKVLRRLRRTGAVKASGCGSVLDRLRGCNHDAQGSGSRFTVVARRAQCNA